MTKDGKMDKCKQIERKHPRKDNLDCQLNPRAAPLSINFQKSEDMIFDFVCCDVIRRSPHS